MSSHHRFHLASLIVLAVAAACGGPGHIRSYSSDGSLAGAAAAVRGTGDDPATRREYGPAVSMGGGIVRTYITFGEGNHAVPLEVGVAITEGAMEGLPKPNPNFHAPADGHEHIDSHGYDLELPAQNPTPYRFVQLNWNPAGHPLPGIYDLAHFDFHFYTVPQAVRNSIDPKALGDSAYAAKSASLPPKEEWSPFVQALTPPGQPLMAVPQMGAHWVDVRTPELQRLLGNPGSHRPFTTTMIRGSWDGRFIFDEPMITRDFILSRKTAIGPAQRDSVIAIPQPQRRNPAGYYPDAYRITYDSKAREYRVALTKLVWRD